MSLADKCVTTWKYPTIIALTRQKLWLVASCGILFIASATAGFVAAEHRLLLWGVLALAMGSPLIVLLVASPNVCTLAVIFVLYSNAAAVAVHAHGVPAIIAHTFFLILLAPLVYFLIVKRQRVIVTSALPLIALFVLIQAIGILVSERPDYSVGIVASSLIEGLGLYFLMVNVVRTPEMLRRVIWTMLAAGVFIGGPAAYQQFTGNYGNTFGGFSTTSGKHAVTVAEAGTHRVGGPLDGPNQFAQILLLLIPLGVFCYRNERSRSLRAMAVFATLLIGAGCLSCFSRGAFVAFAVMLLVAGSMGIVRFRDVAIVGAMGVASIFLVPKYQQRIATIPTARSFIADNGQKPDSSMRGRMTEMIAAIKMFYDNPILGVGAGMNKYYMPEYSKDIHIKLLTKNRRSHSLFPDIAADYGILGLTCFVAILYVTMRNLTRARARCQLHHPYLANLASAFFLVITAYLATGVFIHFSYIRYFWLMMALAGVAAHLGTGVATDAAATQALPRPTPRLTSA